MAIKVGDRLPEATLTEMIDVETPGCTIGPIFTKALGLDMDLTARGMGVRSQRYSMLVENGVVKKLNIEAAGKYEVSGAETMLAQI